MFSIVLKYHDPALLRYLEWHNIEPQLFCINWLMTFFARYILFKFKQTFIETCIYDMGIHSN